MQSGRLVRRTRVLCAAFLIFSADCEGKGDSAAAIFRPQKRRNTEPLETALGTGEEGGTRGGRQPQFAFVSTSATLIWMLPKIRPPVISVCLPAASAQTRPVSTTLTTAHPPSLPLYPSAPLPPVLTSSHASEFALPVSPFFFLFPPHPIAGFFFFSLSLSLLSP